jgi:hypothetical protein
MSDTPKPTPLPEGHPGQHFPTVYAEGTLSTSWKNGIAKFYLYRLDPNFLAGKDSGFLPVAQVILPIEGFAATAIFFRHQLKRMVDAGAISAEEVARLEALYAAES